MSCGGKSGQIDLVEPHSKSRTQIGSGSSRAACLTKKIDRRHRSTTIPAAQHLFQLTRYGRIAQVRYVAFNRPKRCDSLFIKAVDPKKVVANASLNPQGL